mmetsp:Transcript_57229/g.153214  ORF Transcript_57229/g.153214 Transcript_57229/m.153214 type:complete len:849 (-) Transcript_57229:344-2890(-)
MTTSLDSCCLSVPWFGSAATPTPTRRLPLGAGHRWRCVASSRLARLQGELGRPEAHALLDAVHSGRRVQNEVLAQAALQARGEDGLLQRRHRGVGQDEGRLPDALGPVGIPRRRVARQQLHVEDAGHILVGQWPIIPSTLRLVLARLRVDEHFFPQVHAKTKHEPTLCLSQVQEGAQAVASVHQHIRTKERVFTCGHVHLDFRASDTGDKVGPGVRRLRVQVPEGKRWRRVVLGALQVVPLGDLELRCRGEQGAGVCRHGALGAVCHLFPRRHSLLTACLLLTEELLLHWLQDGLQLLACQFCGFAEHLCACRTAVGQQVGQDAGVRVEGADLLDGDAKLGRTGGDDLCQATLPHLATPSLDCHSSVHGVDVDGNLSSCNHDVADGVLQRHQRHGSLLEAVSCVELSVCLLPRREVELLLRRRPQLRHVPLRNLREGRVHCLALRLQAQLPHLLLRHLELTRHGLDDGLGDGSGLREPWGAHGRAAGVVRLADGDLSAVVGNVVGQVLALHDLVNDVVRVVVAEAGVGKHLVVKGHQLALLCGGHAVVALDDVPRVAGAAHVRVDVHGNAYGPACGLAGHGGSAERGQLLRELAPEGAAHGPVLDDDVLRGAAQSHHHARLGGVRRLAAAIDHDAAHVLGSRHDRLLLHVEVVLAADAEVALDDDVRGVLEGGVGVPHREILAWHVRAVEEALLRDRVLDGEDGRLLGRRHGHADGPRGRLRLCEGGGHDKAHDHPRVLHRLAGGHEDVLLLGHKGARVQARHARVVHEGHDAFHLERGRRINGLQHAHLLCCDEDAVGAERAHDHVAAVLCLATRLLVGLHLRAHVDAARVTLRQAQLRSARERLRL